MLKHSTLWIAAVAAICLSAVPSPASAKTCSVPNAIANGQIADASKVMDNFNAIANCAQLGVTTTATPAAGSIPVFSSSSTITNGNLSGDVTTSGGTTTTLSNSGVTAGTYSNANLTIDAKGRITSAMSATGNSGLWWFSPPAASQFMAASSDNILPTLGDDPNVGFVLSTPAPGSSSNDQYRIAYEILPSGNWEVVTRLTLNVAGVIYQGGGLVAYESSTGKILGLIGFNNSNTRSISMRSGTLTAYGADNTIWNNCDSTIWVKMAYNSSASTYSGYVSSDGKNWTLMNVVSGSSVFSSAADRVGIAIFNSQSGGAGIPISVSSAYWKQSW